MDLQTIPPDLRLDYIHIGRDYGSLKVRDQAHTAEEAYKTHGAALASFGFKRSHLDTMMDLVGQYPQGIDDRASVHLTKQESSAALNIALKSGKAARLMAKSQLEGALLALNLAPEVRIGIAATQRDTATLNNRRSDAMTQHLNRLLVGVAAASSALDPEAVATTTTALEAAIAQLQAAQKAATANRGTSAETERLDLIDGAIVTHLRVANKAAKAAAKALGQPALAKAFSLKILHS